MYKLNNFASKSVTPTLLTVYYYTMSHMNIAQHTVSQVYITTHSLTPVYHSKQSHISYGKELTTVGESKKFVEALSR